jgi:hypothetical protein
MFSLIIEKAYWHSISLEVCRISFLMKLSMKLKALAASAVLAFGANTASAVPLSDADALAILVGSWAPGSGYNSDAEVVIGANKLITWENGGANPNPDAAAVFTDAPTNFGPLPAAVFVGKDDQAPFVGVDAGLYDYALGKYGNSTFLFYLGGLTNAVYELPSSITGGAGGLSHVSWFTPATTVPDGGATVALLGLGLAALALIRRKISS